MALYDVSETFYFRETGQKIIAGKQQVELTDEQAEAYKTSHPGLLKAAKRTTQAEVKVTKSSKATVKK